MVRKRSLINMTLAGAFLTTSILGMGCASGPRYGASRKHNKSCDCPHWNAVPRQDERGIWSQNDNPARTVDHGARN